MPQSAQAECNVDLLAMYLLAKQLSLASKKPAPEIAIFLSSSAPLTMPP